MILNTIQASLNPLISAQFSSASQSQGTRSFDNSFIERLSEAFSGSIHKEPPGSAAGAAAVDAAAVARQAFAASRRSFVTSSYNAADAPSPEAAPAAPFTNLATTSSNTVASLNPPPSMPAYTAASPAPSATTTSPMAPSSSDPTSSATAPGASSDTPSPEDIVAGLLQDNAPPPAYAQLGSPSTDANIYMSGSYMRDLNLNSYLQIANHDNAYRYDTYRFQVNTWAANGMQGSPPTPPKYETVDVVGFDSWWQQYCANPGQDAPAVTFLANGPKIPGQYGWTSA